MFITVVIIMNISKVLAKNKLIVAALILVVAIPVRVLSQPAQQTTLIELQNHFVAKGSWKIVQHFSDELATVVTLVPNQKTFENTNNYIQQIIFPYPNIKGAPAKKMVEDIFFQVTKECKQSHSRIVSETNQYVFYTINSAGCHSQNTYRTGKVFNGKDAVYVIRYTADDSKVSPQKISMWTHAIGNAKLIANPQYTP
jgi:hypothetical protein